MKAFRALGAVLLLLLAAVPALADDVESEAKVKNKDPKIDRIDFDEEDDDPSTPGMQFLPASEDERDIRIKVRVKDDNGHRDVRKLSMTLFKSDNSTTVLGPIEAEKDDDSGGRSSVWTGEVALASDLRAGRYFLRVQAEDKPGSKALGTTSFEIMEVLAMSVSGSVAFGDLQPGAVTSAKTVTIRNVGNVPIDLEVAATPLASDEASIPASYLKTGLSDSGATAAMSGTPLLLGNFNLEPGSSASKAVYFKLHVPSGDEQYVPQGDYRGTITLSAVVDA